MTTLLDFFKARRPQDFAADFASESPAAVMARAEPSDAQPSPAANPYADVPSSDSQPVASPQVASGGVAPAESASAPPSAAPDHFGGNVNGQQATHDVTPQQVTKSVEPQSERAPTRMERIADWYATKQAALEKEAGAAMQGLDAEEKRNRAQSAVNALKLRQEAVGAMVTRDYGGADSLLGRASEVEQHALSNPEARREQLQRFYESRRGQLSGEASNMIAQQREEDRTAAELAKARAHEAEAAAQGQAMDSILLQKENVEQLPERLRDPKALSAVPLEEKKLLYQGVIQGLNRNATEANREKDAATAEANRRADAAEAAQRALSNQMTLKKWELTLPKNAPEAIVEQYGALQNAPAAIKQFEENLAKVSSLGGKAGAAAGGLASTGLLGETAARGASFQSDSERTAIALARGLEGGMARPGNVEIIQKMLPKPSDSAEVKTEKMAQLKRFVEEKKSAFANTVRAGNFNIGALPDSSQPKPQTINAKPVKGQQEKIPGTDKVIEFDGKRWVEVK